MQPMRTARNYLPYEELSVERQDPEKTLRVVTPWLAFRLQMDLASAEDTTDIVNGINDRTTLDRVTYPKVNWFLRQFSRYPFAYIVPRPGLEGMARYWFGEAAHPKTPRALARGILDACDDDDLRLTAEQRQHLMQLLPQRWQWARRSAYQLARSPGTASVLDPLTIFSIVKRYHLITYVNRDRSFKLYETISQTTATSPYFGSLAALTVRQNHFVTEMCARALAPALTRAGATAPLLQEFMQAEIGHDLMLRQALQYMGRSPEEVPALPATKFAMLLLRYAAQTNLLGFACALDMFERDDFQSRDAFASALQAGGWTKAAKLVQKHKDINEAGAHDEIGLRLLGPDTGGITLADAASTFSVAELLSLTLNQISGEILATALAR